MTLRTRMLSCMLLLTGCASHPVQPTVASAQIFHIADVPATAALVQAASQCPTGYHLLGDAQPSSRGYDMTIQCH
jgi:hypothetical protein